MLNTLCPICKNRLAKKSGSAVCPNGHTFDFAKEGYLYLLPPDARHSKDPGDNKDMVAARKKFLDGGYYAPLANAVSDIIASRYADTPVTIIDAGVGTGYYLEKFIASRMRTCAYSIKDVYLGADISKHAVRYAAKANEAAECCVASVYALPYESGCADIITCLFSPYALDEYKRLLKDGGILIIASPCEKHLIELRCTLYDDVRPVETPLNTDGFKTKFQTELQYEFTLNCDGISALLAMTPYAYRAPKDKVDALQNIASMSLTADFKLTVLEKAHC